MMRVFCSSKSCGKLARGYSVMIPDQARGWCKECHQQIGVLSLTRYFCSPEHALEYLQDHIQSSEQKAKMEVK